MIKADIKFINKEANSKNIIKVIGVGGAGTNAVNYMHDKNIKGVDLIVCNTDKQSLMNSPISNKIQLSETLTEGLGSGEDPELAEQAALDSKNEIKQALLVGNTKMVLVVAGMGKGTGTGASHIVAQIAKDLDILTIGVVTKPFSHEGPDKEERYEYGVKKLENNVDAILVIVNDKLNQIYSDLEIELAYKKIDKILMNCVVCMSKIINYNYTQNVDFKDIQTILKGSGTVMIGEGVGSGKDRAKQAIENALKSPLLLNSQIKNAKNILVLLTEREDDGIKMSEMDIIMKYAQQQVSDKGDNKANIIQGFGIDKGSKLSKGQIGVSIIASKFEINKDSQNPQIINYDYDADKIADDYKEDSYTGKTIDVYP